MPVTGNDGLKLAALLLPTLGGVFN